MRRDAILWGSWLRTSAMGLLLVPALSLPALAQVREVRAIPLGLVVEPLPLPIPVGLDLIRTSPGIIFRNVGPSSGIDPSVFGRARNRADGSFTYETDGIFSDVASVGLSRVEASLGARISGGVRFFAYGDFGAQQSPFFGQGFDKVSTYVPGGAVGTIRIPFDFRNTDSLDAVIPAFVQFGGQCDQNANVDAVGNAVSCRGRRFAQAWSTDLDVGGRLEYSYSNGSRISFTRRLSRSQHMNSNSFLTESIGGAMYETDSYAVDWYHTVVMSRGQGLWFNVNISQQNDRLVAGSLDRSWDLENRSATVSAVFQRMRFAFDDGHFSDDVEERAVTKLRDGADWRQLIDNVRSNLGTQRPRDGDSTVDRVAVPRLNPFACICGLLNTGSDWGLQLTTEDRLVGRATVEWRTGGRNLVRLGGLFSDATRRHIATDLNASGGDAYTGDPQQIQFYVQDRFDFGNVVVEAGFRWQRYNANGLFPKVPGRIFSHPDFEVGLTGSSNVFDRSRSHGELLPLARVSVSMGDQTAVWGSYIGVAESPTAADVYHNSNGDISNLDSLATFGSDAGFARLNRIRVGLTHIVNGFLTLNLSSFHENRITEFADVSVDLLDPVLGDVRNAVIFSVVDADRDVRGLDLQLDYRGNRYLSGQFEYRYRDQLSVGTNRASFSLGSDAVAHLGVVLDRPSFAARGDRPEPAGSGFALDDRRRHELAGAWAVRFPRDFPIGPLRDFSIFGVFRYRSGLAYTPVVLNEGSELTSNDPFNLFAGSGLFLSAETPWTKQLDVRITKGFDVGRTRLLFYADVDNLLNFRNLNKVFVETGRAQNPQHFEQNFLEPGLLRLSNEARASGFHTFVDVAGESVEAVDLTNDCLVWVGEGGPLACEMLRAAELRFGNGDGIYDETEQEVAIRSFYDVSYGESNFLGAQRHARIGLQLTF